MVPYLYNKYDYGVTNVTVILQASVNSSWVDAFKYKFDEMYTGYNVETTGEESVTLNSIVAANTNTLFDNGGKWIYSGSTIDLRVKTIIEPYA